jgi:hypothetical protein
MGHFLLFFKSFREIFETQVLAFCDIGVYEFAILHKKLL